uniref:Acid-sensing ion channel 1-like n=1 Tax=Saccoglossus kowalevskii TaxID=10224 RepID=A0ABM0LY03_SACKO|nr:PREDICTED: acid-sensing ion channel 1-like [Saccoglossus kowalevskii]
MPQLTLRNFALETADVHGVKHLANSRSGVLRRLVWLVAFLGSVALLLYQCISSIIYFVNYHHVTKVEVNYTTQMEFPAVTFCNLNKYRESAITVEDIVNIGEHIGIVDDQHEIIDPHLYTDKFLAKMSAVNWTHYTKDYDYNMTDFTFRTGHQASDFILQCEYSGENCSYEDFSHVFSHHGNCFTFNKHDENNAVLLSKRAGTGNGLRLILGIETEEYTPSNDLDGDAMDAGIKLLVHGVKEPPYVKELGFVASPGFHTYVSLRKALETSTSPS